MKFVGRLFAAVLLSAAVLAPAAVTAAQGNDVAQDAAAAQEWKKLLTPAELETLRKTVDVRLIDIRVDKTPADGNGPYTSGHLPGAVAAPYGQWRGPQDNPGHLPDEQQLGDLVRKLGLTLDTPAVIVYAGTDATDFGAAARVYWTLKSLGVEQVAILNGGQKAWEKASLPLSKDEVQVAASDYQPSLSNRWRATREEVAAIIHGDQKHHLVDARPEPFFHGKAWHPAAKRPGTLSGAENLTYTAWFEDGATTIVGADKAKAIVRDAGLQDGTLTVSFCNTGHWAATNWFALSELAGLEDVKLYAESMVDWSKTDRPMANVPGRMEWYWLATKKWLQERL